MSEHGPESVERNKTLRSLTHFISALVVIALTLSGCKKDDPADEAKRALQEGDPDKALPLLKAEYEKDRQNYEILVGLAQAYKTKKKPNWERSVAFYRLAIGHSKVPSKEEKDLLKGHLLDSLDKLIEQGRAEKLEDKKLGVLLRDANKLERDLGRQVIKHGKELLDRLTADFDAFVKAKQYDAAIAELSKLDGIYADQKAKQRLLDQKSVIEETKFREEALSLFVKSFQPGLIEAGHYKKDQDGFLLTGSASNTVGAEGALDATQKGFQKAMQAKGCASVAKADLGAMLNPFATQVLSRELDPKEQTVLMGETTECKCKWKGEAWKQAETYEDGTEMVLECQQTLSIRSVITGFKLFWRRPQTAPKGQ